MDREQAFKDYCQTTPRGGRLECVNWEEQAFKAGATWQADQAKAAIEFVRERAENTDSGTLLMGLDALEKRLEL